MAERPSGPPGRDPAGDPVGREEAEAVLATRAELGPGYDAELAEAFAERVERAVEARVAERTREVAHRNRASEGAGGRQMVLGIVSLGTGIPITAIAGSFADTQGVLLAWAGIVGVNAAHAWQSRRLD